MLTLTVGIEMEHWPETSKLCAFPVLVAYLKDVHFTKITLIQSSPVFQFTSYFDFINTLMPCVH